MHPSSSLRAFQRDQDQTSWNQSPCTPPPPQELSKETKTERHGTKAHAPSSSSRTFQRDQEHDLNVYSDFKVLDFVRLKDMYTHLELFQTSNVLVAHIHISL